MSKKDEILSLSNKVHVLSSDISHLEAQVERLRKRCDKGDKSLRGDINEMQEKLKNTRREVESLRKWIDNRQGDIEIEEEWERKQNLKIKSKIWQLFIGLIIAIISSGLTLLIGYLLQ